MHTVWQKLPASVDPSHLSAADKPCCDVFHCCSSNSCKMPIPYLTITPALPHTEELCSAACLTCLLLKAPAVTSSSAAAGAATSPLYTHKTAKLPASVDPSHLSAADSPCCDVFQCCSRCCGCSCCPSCPSSTLPTGSATNSRLPGCRSSLATTPCPRPAVSSSNSSHRQGQK
jgi:hypothetical protein